MTSNHNMQPESSSNPEEVQSEQSPPPKPTPPWWRVLLILILLGLGGGVAYTWYFIYYQLSPTVAKSLSEILSRPVEVGEVESFSLTSLEFGETVLPPSPDHSEQVTIPSVEVDFTPLKLLTQQTLELDVTLVSPDATIEQTKQGEWLTTNLTVQSPGFIEFKLETLNVENADIAVSSRNREGKLKAPVNLTLGQLNSQFRDNNQRIQFELDRLSVANTPGNLNLQGEARLESGEVDLAVTSNKLAIGSLARLVPSPFEKIEGNLDADTELNLSLDGNLPSFQGTAEFNEVNAKVDQFSTSITDTNAQLRLAEQDIVVENFTTQFGGIEATAGGKINLAQGYDLTANVKPTPISSLLSAVEIQPDVPVSGTIQAKIDITGALDKPQIDIAASSTQPIQIDQVQFQQFQTALSLQGTELVVENFQATPNTGGQIAAQGKIGLTPEQKIALDVRLQNVSGELIRPYQPNLPSNLGTLNASGKITGALSKWQSLQAEGKATLAIAEGTVTLPQLQLSEGRVQAKIQVNQLKPQQLAPQVPPQFQNPVSGQFRLNANLADFSPEKIRLTGEGELKVPQGEIAATAVTFNEGQLNANFTLTKIPLALLAPQTPPEFNELLSAQLNVNADVEAFDLNQIQGTSSGSLTLTNGDRAQVNLNNLRLNQGNWQGNIQASNLNLYRLVPQLPQQFQNSRFNTQLKAQGTLDNLTPKGITVRGTGEINQLLGGKITADVLRLEKGNFQIVASPANFELARLSNQLQGKVGGQVTVGGNLNNLTPAGINAQANLDFSQGLALIANPLTTRLRWDGEKVILEQAQAKNFQAEGTVAVNLNQQGQEIIEQFDLTVDAQQLDLSQLPLPTAQPVGKIDVQGLADFSGNLTGTLNQPQVQGTIGLQNFAVERFTFDSKMTGGIQVNSQQGIQLNLVGNSQTPDRIQLALSSPQQKQLLPLEPASFVIKRDSAIAQGKRQGQTLQVNLQELPLDLLKDFAPLPKEFANQPASGKLNGDLAVDWKQLGVSGELALENPSLGRFNSDRVTAEFRYANQIFNLKQAALLQQESEYRASGRLNLSKTSPDFEANLDIKQGRIQDILSALQLFDLSEIQQDFATPEYGNAQDLDVASINIKNDPLETQLRRFSEIQSLLAQMRDKQDTATAIPSLASAQGNFTGSISLTGTSFQPQDIQGEFRLDGNQWQWGPYQAQSVLAEGKIDNGIVTLLPVRFASGESYINLSGTFGGQNQSAQLQVNQIPVATLQNVVEVPEFIGVSGFVNGTATVAGTPENPTARGELQVNEATLNETPIDTIQGSFSYSNSQLNFFAKGLLSPDSDPLILSGKLPYQLPFAKVPPASDNLNIEISLQDEGFALLDVISKNQLTWKGGEGQVNLAINGPFNPENFQLEQLNTSGVITLSDASVGTAFLPDPLTNINSRVEFNFNQASVEQFNADFGGGKVTATGEIALFNPDAASQLLNIDLQNLAVDIPDLYQGNVAGNINLGRTAIEPLIGGEITLSEGEIMLAQGETAPAENGQGRENGQGTENGQGNNNLSNVGFNNLTLNLGKNVKVTREPIMNFVADGSLNVNGTLADLRPKGTISLQRGQVNLGTSQFRLAKGYEQTARFTPSQGLDPTLNGRLVTSVAETSGSFRNESRLSEPSDGINANIGTLQSVRVEALVRGRASELQPGQLTPNNEVLTLSSDPNRSETEIIALLGGGLTSGFGQGNTAFGIANLASSTFLGSFQNTIGDALGLSDFRIFPTLIPTETEEGEDSGSNSSLGFGAEAGINISENLSFSVLTIFNANQRFQYSIRYRLSDDILLRGATDLTDNNSFIIEYETRF